MRHDYDYDSFMIKQFIAIAIAIAFSFKYINTSMQMQVSNMKMHFVAGVSFFASLTPFEATRALWNQPGR